VFGLSAESLKECINEKSEPSLVIPDIREKRPNPQKRWQADKASRIKRQRKQSPEDRAERLRRIR
jgi:hypothetical protein